MAPAERERPAAKHRPAAADWTSAAGGHETHAASSSLRTASSDVAAQRAVEYRNEEVPASSGDSARRGLEPGVHSPWFHGHGSDSGALLEREDHDIDTQGVLVHKYVEQQQNHEAGHDSRGQSVQRQWADIYRQQPQERKVLAWRASKLTAAPTASSRWQRVEGGKGGRRACRHRR